MDDNKVAQEVLALISAEGTVLSDDMNQVEQAVRECVLRIGASQWQKDGGDAANYSGYEGMDKLTAVVIESVTTRAA